MYYSTYAMLTPVLLTEASPLPLPLPLALPLPVTVALPLPLPLALATPKMLRGGKVMLIPPEGGVVTGGGVDPYDAFNAAHNY